jgi:hypothetical protein
MAYSSDLTVSTVNDYANHVDYAAGTAFNNKAVFVGGITLNSTCSN